MYRSSKRKKLSEIFAALRPSLKKTSLFNVINQFEVRAVVLSYRKELSSGRAMMSTSFIFRFLSNQVEDVYTKRLYALSMIAAYLRIMEGAVRKLCYFNLLLIFVIAALHEDHCASK